MDTATATALIEEATRRAGLVWVRRVGNASPPRPLWAAWIDHSLYLLTGGIEQPMPDGLDQPGARAEVTVASKDKGSRLVVWIASVTRVSPGSDEWPAIVPALAAQRLNAPDGDSAPARWARECTVLRLIPTGEVR